MMWRWLIVSLALITSVSLVAAQSPWEETVLQRMAAYDIEGTIIMIVDGEEIVYLNGLGVNAAGQPFGLEATYDLGWAAEPFVGLLMMQQAERRALAPDSPLIDLMPNFNLSDRPNATSATTVARLLTHSAGLGQGELAPLTPLSAEEILAIEPEFFAGARFSYCRQCVGLQLDLLESLTGSTLPDLLEQEIFYPLQMDETSVQDGHLISTPADLAKWMSIHLQKGRWRGVQLVKPETLALTHRALQETQRTPREYAGYGWVVTIENGLQVVEETEDRIITTRDVGNYQAQMTLIPAYQIGILILTDQPTQSLDPLMEVLLEEFADFTPPEFSLPSRPDLLAGNFLSEDVPFDGLLTITWEENETYSVTYQNETRTAKWVDERVLGTVLNGRETFLYFPEVGRPRTVILVQDWRTSLFNRRE